MDLSFLPTINATINVIVTVMLVVGYVKIRRGQIQSHRRTMISAFGLSMLFLVLYVIHKVWKASAGEGLHTSYNAEGIAKVAYLLILFTHLVLAMTVPIFATLLIYLGLTKRYTIHRRIARFAWPIWMYVSITGVVIYVMLYHLNPAQPPAG